MAGRTCAIPALALLVENARVGFGPAEFMRLKDRFDSQSKSKRTLLSAPTISTIFDGEGLYTHLKAEAVLEPLKKQIDSVGAHWCPNCSRILEYNTLTVGLGEFIQHIQTRRENQTTDIVETIAITCGISNDLLRDHMQGTTLPSFVVDKLLFICRTLYASHADQQGLHARTLSPGKCKPPQTASSWLGIHGRYLNDNCAKCRS